MILEESTMLKDVRSEHGDHVFDWKFISVNTKDDARVYYFPMNEQPGVYFYAVEWIANYSGQQKWSGETFIECLFQGIAYYDGVRHMYMGSEQTDNYGYLNYPDFNNIVDTVKVLEDLEKQFCNK